jgi:hypothetical protein
MKSTDIEVSLLIIYWEIIVKIPYIPRSMEKMTALPPLSTKINLKIYKCINIFVLKKSQHGCVRWALREHLTPPCYDFACAGLEDRPHTQVTNKWIFIGSSNNGLIFYFSVR